MLSAEPRALADGKTVLVSPFSCGIFGLDSLTSNAASSRLVSPFRRKEGTYCAIPVIAGHYYYLVTVPAWNAVVSLDISDPVAPKDVSRVTLGAKDVPHWIYYRPGQAPRGGNWATDA